MVSPYLLNTIYFYLWKIKISQVHDCLLLDDQQLCIRYIYSREDLLDMPFLNEAQVETIVKEVPFNRPYHTFVIDNISIRQMELLVNLPHLKTMLCQYIKNQNGNVSNEVVDLIFDIRN